ncbi:protein kinase domain-containing protein [Catenulispora rubra]|uniref:protein kinase domain-containing protein n=1 Tax=Catenulispora rubra TaxID=280293 RepID=UPI002B2777D8|nr:protein kinase [Catenulispora rubra]
MERTEEVPAPLLLPADRDRPRLWRGRCRRSRRPIPYLVMEPLAGRTLAKVLADDDLPTPALALAWAVQMCVALEAAHRADVVHCDIKPGNEMVTADGVVKVPDFGIARFVATESAQGTLAATGTIIGSLPYTSPEQADGKKADARRGLYFLGCLLYTLLTGRPPFTGDSPAAVIAQHLRAVPQPPSAGAAPPGSAGHASE